MPPLKTFIDNFDFNNPDWQNLPDNFPDSDLTGLTSAGVGRFNAIRSIYQLMPPEQKSGGLIKNYGGYRDLKSYQNAELICDLTVEFISRYIDKKSRTCDQMEQAARSGKQNIAEGSKTAATSRQSELRLVNVARASLEELLLDYEDFLRQRKLEKWNINDKRVKAIRELAYKSDRSYPTYSSYLSNPEPAANVLICLINQTNFLLDKQIQALANDYEQKGDFKDRVRTWKKQQLLNRYGQ